MDGGLAAVTAAVAAAVGLQEGEAGVARILVAIRRLAPAPTREISRHTGIPVPLVSAVAGELRRRGLLTTGRPARLTDRGLALLADSPGYEPWCPCCAGRGLAPLPAALAPAQQQLAELMARAPGVDVTLDQSYSTVETKLRRIALLLGLDLLPAERALLVGDDDLMSVSLVAAGAALGQPLVRQLAVVDISAELLAFLREALAGVTEVELCRHDLRDPLPDRLRGRFDLAMTDPPYTVAGARLFLSRAVEGLLPGAGRPVVFSFGAKGPADTLALQRAVVDIGLTVQASYRNFNEYEGSGVLGSTSHLSWLATTAQAASTVPGRFAGPFYTAQSRPARARRYRCTGCGTTAQVGAGARWSTVAQLRAAGCPACGAGRFRPLGLVTT